MEDFNNESPLDSDTSDLGMETERTQLPQQTIEKPSPRPPTVCFFPNHRSKKMISLVEYS